MRQPDDQPHTEADDQPDDQPARWMTFAELAKSRGISKLSAAALVRRHGWRRQRDNRGHVIALVPHDGPELRRPIASQPDYPPDDQAYQAENQVDDRADHQPHIAAFEAALTAVEAAHASEVAALRDQLDGAARDRLDAQARADATIADIGRRVERAEAATAEERSRADGFRERAESAERDLAVARHDAEAAQQAAAEFRLTEEARKGRGRLRRAWDGWRGR